MTTSRKRVGAAAAVTMMAAAASMVFVAHPAAAVTCSVTPAPGVSAVSIRSQKSTTSGYVITTLYAGQYLPSLCQSESGGYYSSCGGSSYWIYIPGELTWPRWVAAACVRLVKDRVGT
ncbi:hypothetical protein SAMN05421833_128101 [Microbispora rosea]|uniref:SH3 domain-containing protein n=1 Tax=Microbispora rosea TaxID=58117 RepID=A0A1N7GFN9_9ACTN|nr:hypothetical protein [Microbispora rosea]GIH50700.1 hypothetical protein Mro03_58790 [Microbispora rosea subsp. rosea]SIS11358.1 hypothetical protein SAMN05421833_128101 [Microbispora rosea]